MNGTMDDNRPFFRVTQMTKHDAAVQQIEAAIEAFHAGRFAVAITLAGAAEEMAPEQPGGVWTSIRDNEGRPIRDTKKWASKLNETRNWLKHDRPEPARNLASFEVGIAIIRAIDKWDPPTPAMEEFKELFLNSPLLIHPDQYDGPGVRIRND